MSFQEIRSNFLKIFAETGSITLSLLLILFNQIMDEKFACPCRNDQNTALTVSVFIGPAFFAFVLMFHLLRPLRYGWFHCPEGEKDTLKNCPKTLISCLVPPVLWIFILLLDGDYVACAMTDWKGVYEFDMELHMLWCKPTEGMRNETELRELTLKYIHQSWFSSYVLLSVFSALSLAVLGFYDCCISGKCDRCPSRLLLFFGRKERYSRGNAQDDVELSPTSSITTHPLIAFLKKE